MKNRMMLLGIGLGLSFASTTFAQELPEDMEGSAELAPLEENASDAGQQEREEALAMRRSFEALERVREDSLTMRESVAATIAIEGAASAVAGVVMMFPDDYDQAIRYAGINTAAFGAINVLVGSLALNGIAKERERWDEAKRRGVSPERRLAHAIEDERRESVGHAINLGLAGAYAAVGGMAIGVSRAGVDHPDRWLASGIAISSQAVFLATVDLLGMAKSKGYHDELAGMVTPMLSVSASDESVDPMLGLSGSF